MKEFAHARRVPGLEAGERVGQRECCVPPCHAMEYQSHPARIALDDVRERRMEKADMMRDRGELVVEKRAHEA